MAEKIKYPTVDILSPLGRLVEGDLYEGSLEGYQGKVLESEVFYFALAVPKNDPATPAMLQAIEGHAWQSSQMLPIAMQRIQAFRIGSPPPAIEGQKPPYAWKIDDGDGPKRRGRAGQAGCWILKFSGGFRPKIFNAQNGIISDKNQLPYVLGQYARVKFSAVINGLQDDQAGIFLNYNGVRIEPAPAGAPVGQIVPGPTAEQMFGAALPAMDIPAGTPIGGLSPVAALTADLRQGVPFEQVAAQHLNAPFQAPQPAPMAQQSAFLLTASSSPVMAPSATAALGVDHRAIPAEHVAAYFNVRHHVGYRFNPDTRGYEPDPTPPPTTALTAAPAQPAGGVGNAYPSNPTPLPASALAAPAGVSAAPAPLGVIPGSGAPTASPFNPPPGVQPHPGFLTGQATGLPPR